MNIEKQDYSKLRNFYRGYFIHEFDDDYYIYRAVIRLINSYFKNPNYKKTHDIYNRMVVLHRVFDKKFINEEIINTCDTAMKQYYLKLILNSFFNSKYEILKYKRCWKKDIDILKKSGIVCKV